MTVLVKMEIADQLVPLGFRRPEAHRFVDVFFDEIKQSLAQGEPVGLSGLGKFSVHDKSARLGRNPKTGDTMMIDARRVVTFTTSKVLISKIKEARD